MKAKPDVDNTNKFKISHFGKEMTYQELKDQEKLSQYVSGATINNEVASEEEYETLLRKLQAYCGDNINKSKINNILVEFFHVYHL